MKQFKVFFISLGFCLIMMVLIWLIPTDYLRAIPVWVLATIIITGTVFTFGFSVYAFAKYARRDQERIGD